MIRFIFLFFISFSLFSFPTYQVVIDPGHGGIAKDPTSEHGDKYDSITMGYLEKYKQGTESGKVTEREVVLALSKEVEALLRLTETEEGWVKFSSYLGQFSKSKTFPRIIIKSVLTRKTNSDSDPSSSDPNAPYRLYDFPDPKTGVRKKGRISFINDQKPHLVLSLHLNPAGRGQVGGMAAVLTPGYSTFNLLKEISEGKKKPKEFLNKPWSDWMVFAGNWSKLENAVADAWIYFHGYWSDRSGKKTELDKFEGYRQNMVSWKYSDEKGWESKANAGGKGPYSKTHSGFRAEGAFFEREKGKKETWRREGGREGFGGDNYYAAKELMRFVQYGLRLQLKGEKGYPEVGPIQNPYISTYSLPTYTNAICAFIEIGYINRKRDIKYLTENKKETAISLAVGIYSLFNGIEVRKFKNMPIFPKGKKVNWNRYGDYFEEVAAP
ncbi:N-acetylmuramoyl-L-alanine amidase [Leptospira ilyithenensis]|uniref:N-acetylmuramoyl-L-alanine amidase n=1 Tax=Leptospira ilyithenensis TaxID=2484901 RepID=UPI001AF01EE8|nr:N-acetylmuramoyl-L-alanine amidase [Leptospira ilyithenensis]